MLVSKRFKVYQRWDLFLSGVNAGQCCWHIWWLLAISWSWWSVVAIPLHGALSLIMWKASKQAELCSVVAELEEEKIKIKSLINELKE